MSGPADGLLTGEDGKSRCWWHGGHPEYVLYHDDEWGRPTFDDRTLFEKICLEGFQSGLSWLTILRKRENFRAGFANFEPAAVARFTGKDVERLLGDAGIIRHRGKIEATINNAQRALELIEKEGSIARFVWSYEPKPGERPARIDRASLSQFTQSPASVALSKELKRRGWRFFGPTTAYAFMQAMGLVNDHLEGCWCRAEVEAARQQMTRPA
jgi:DNA-3-methyladenine glycosylase I